LVAAASATASTTKQTARPTLTLVQRMPLVVRGAHFSPGERVRLTVTRGTHVPPATPRPPEGDRRHDARRRFGDHGTDRTTRRPLRLRAAYLHPDRRAGDRTARRPRNARGEAVARVDGRALRPVNRPH